MLYSIGYKRKGGAMNIMRMMGVFLSSLSVLSGIVCFLGKAFELF